MINILVRTFTMFWPILCQQLQSAFAATLYRKSILQEWKKKRGLHNRVFRISLQLPRDGRFGSWVLQISRCKRNSLDFAFKEVFELSQQILTIPSNTTSAERNF